MSRWDPNARERLERAAMELYRERGFDQTTVSEIAARAGLTERTFFRYFADKREVLFGGAEQLRELLARGVAEAAAALSPLDAVARALETTSAMFEERRDFARERQALIAAHPELMERELIKLASLASTIADALRRRGVKEPTASLCGELGIVVFKLAFERWVHDARRRELVQHIQESVRALETVAARKKSPASRARRAP